jgi:hypothetical protein
MRRQLVSLDAFDKIQSDSLSKTEYELMEAENVLSQNLGSGPLSFAFFDDEKVIYETDHGTYIHANYKMNEDSVSFEDIKELVVDHDSQKNRLKECVRKMVESIIDGNDKEANFQFYKYMEEFANANACGKAKNGIFTTHHKEGADGRNIARATKGVTNTDPAVVPAFVILWLYAAKC